jgi:hypothetical protein
LIPARRHRRLPDSSPPLTRRPEAKLAAGVFP